MNAAGDKFVGPAGDRSTPSAAAEAFVEGIAYPPYSADWVALSSFRQRPAQATHAHVDRALVDPRRRPPHGVKQLRAGKHPARLSHDVFEQAELRRRKSDNAQPAPNAPSDPIKVEFPGTEAFHDPLGSAASESLSGNIMQDCIAFAA